jgi:hypothetical protein
VYVFSWIVGERLLTASSLKYVDGTLLKVARRSARTAENDDQKHPANDNQKPTTSRKSEKREPRTVEVRGLTETVTVDNLHLYFENKRSGGGPIEDVSMHGKFALITFKNSTGKLAIRFALFSYTSSLEFLAFNIVIIRNDSLPHLTVSGWPVI